MDDYSCNSGITDCVAETSFSNGCPLPDNCYFFTKGIKKTQTFVYLYYVTHRRFQGISEVCIYLGMVYPGKYSALTEHHMANNTGYKKKCGICQKKKNTSC